MFCKSTSPFIEPKHPTYRDGVIPCQCPDGHDGNHLFEDEFIRHEWGENGQGSAQRKRVLFGGIWSRPGRWYLAAALTLVPMPASAECFRSDVKQLCCPSVCAVKRSPKWYDAPKVLNACMQGLGCSKTSSVYMVCGC